MFPASTTKLHPGDFCFIPRSNGSLVPFVFVCAVANKHSVLYGALADTIVADARLDLVPQKVALLEPALVHISCYKQNNTPIVGNMAERIGKHTLHAAAVAATSARVGSTSKVWGHNTILRYAEAVA
jgi:hypothetical protein